MSDLSGQHLRCLFFQMWVQHRGRQLSLRESVSSGRTSSLLPPLTARKKNRYVCTLRHWEKVDRWTNRYTHWDSGTDGTTGTHTETKWDRWNKRYAFWNRQSEIDGPAGMHTKTVKVGQIDQKVCTLRQSGTEGPAGTHTMMVKVWQADWSWIRADVHTETVQMWQTD